MFCKRYRFHKTLKADVVSDAVQFTFGFTKWSLKIMGLWPLENSFSNFKFYISIFSLLIPTFVFCWGIQYSGNGQNFVDSILYILVMISTMAKMFLVKYYQGNLKENLIQIKADYNNDMFLNDLTKKFIFFNVKLRKYLMCLMIILLSASVTISLVKFYHLSPGGFSQLRDVTFIKHLPRYMLKSPIFELVIVCSAGQLFFWAFTVLTIDSAFLVLVLHAYNRLQAICENVKRYDEQSYLKCIAKRNSKNTCKCMNCIVDNYVAALRFIKKIEDSFNIFLLIEVLRNGLHIGILINNLTWFYRTGSINPLEPTIILSSVSLHLVSICGSIQSMTNAAERIGKSAYELKWYDFKTITVQKITFIILKSQIPCRLTAGKYVHLSLETIRNILAASFSYSSLIMSTRHVLKENAFFDDSLTKS